MKYFVDVSGEEHEVELVERLGELSVRLDGEPIEVTYRDVDRLGQVGLFLGTKSFAVSIQGGAEEASVTVAGHAFDVTVEDERERAARQAERARGGGGGDVKSVMPGVVLRVLVEEGDEVQEGQALLILEAMKMQNELAAPRSGRVQRIHVAEGEAVASGAKLVTLAAESES